MRVEGLGFRVQNLGFRLTTKPRYPSVKGSGFKCVPKTKGC